MTLSAILILVFAAGWFSGIGVTIYLGKLGWLPELQPRDRTKSNLPCVSF